MFTDEDRIISRVANESRAFVSENIKILFKLMLPLIPFVLICDIGNYQVLQYYEEFARYSPFSFLNMILYGTLALSWHKLVMKGYEYKYKTSLLSLNKNDLKFLGVIVLLDALSVTVESFFSYIPESWSWLSIPLSFMLMFFMIWVGLRIGLYFPAAAYGEPMSLREAYKNGLGLPSRLFFSSFLATWRVFLVVTVIMLLPIDSGTDLNAYSILLVALNLVCNPIFTALTVTVLSKYYLIWREENNSEVL